MTPQEFCYWLQGYFEMTGDSAKLTNLQVKMVKRHLSLVFEHAPKRAKKKVELPRACAGVGFNPFTKAAKKAIKQAFIRPSKSEIRYCANTP